MNGEKQQSSQQAHRPTRRNRLIVFLMSLVFMLLLLPEARLLHAGLIGWIVMGSVIGFPVVTINVLLPMTHWERYR